jgi:hypothetical protein
MKILVIPDIHTHYEKAERICRKYSDHKIIFLGDYFDQFKDTPDDNQFTADWLKESLSKPNRIHLRGNHDEQYDPRINVFCSGFSGNKKNAINNVLTVEDWDKLKYFHFENTWLFSHAGVNRHWFGNPMDDKINIDALQEKIENGVVLQKSGNPDNCIWASDKLRAGKHEFGGILWADWRKLDLIPNLKQCVGHTPLHRITTLTDNIINAKNINVDCSAITYMSEVLQVEENGNVNILITTHV